MGYSKALAAAFAVGTAVTLFGCEKLYEEQVREELPLTPEDQILEKWEQDEDKLLSRGDYMAIIRESRIFGAWDANADNILVPEEFGAGMFVIWDGDDDGTIGPIEYAGNRDAWFEEGEKLADFEQVDADGDGQITKEEFVANAGIKKLFDNFDNDNDGQIEQNEYAEGWFLSQDLDRDGYIEEGESLF